jgi:hypothetical protein
MSGLLKRGVEGNTQSGVNQMSAIFLQSWAHCCVGGRVFTAKASEIWGDLD